MTCCWWTQALRDIEFIVFYSLRSNLTANLNNRGMSKLVENYLLQEPIGKGVYGQVYRAVNQKTKQVFAVKTIPKQSFRANPKLEQLAINEINILSSIKHENIVRFIETLKTSNNFYFVYEYCNEGTLESQIRKRNNFSESQALIYFKQLLEAFKELNKNNIMHRDLKPDNIFLSDGKVKLGDFGFCKMLEVNMAQTMLGSPIYMAPEILKQEIYTSKADIWSLGVVLFEMLFGYCPFESRSISELINKLKNLEVEIPRQVNQISDKVEALLRKMLVKDQFKRIEWVDLFRFVIDDQGKIIEGCKEQYLIENMEKYFHSDIGDTPMKASEKLIQHPEENEFPVFSLRKQHSCDETTSPSKKNNEASTVLTTEPTTTKQDTASQSNHRSSNHKHHSLEQKHLLKGEETNQPSLNVVKINENTGRKVRANSMKKNAKEEFIEKHKNWLEAIQLIDSIALNSVDAAADSLCVSILLKKVLTKIQGNAENYPQWTDVIMQEKKILKQYIFELKTNGSDIKQQNANKELIRLWKEARNKFTLERAIRVVYGVKSKDIDLSEILA